VTVFEHPAPAKDPDAIRSFVGTVQALVKVEAERDAALAEVVELSGQLDDVDAQVARVRALHHDDPLDADWCAECDIAWPCPTLNALDGEPS
jgi:hypothetical protein